MNNNIKSVNLPYNYAQVLETGECVGCVTSSYIIDHPLYIEVPDANDAYVGSWYNRADGHWYADSAFSEPLPELDW